MEIKVYGLFESLGLVSYDSEAGEGYVSRKATELYDAMFTGWLLFMILGIALIGFFLARHFLKKEKPDAIRSAVRTLTAVWLVIGVLQAVGIGPYFEFYPTQFSGGFLDLSMIGHMIIGLIYVLSALCFWLGTKLGSFSYDNTIKRKESHRNERL